MKEFNKTQELRKIKFKQNKNTYIKRISIILSCVILIIGVLYFTFAKFESNKSYTLIQGKLGDYSSGDITLSYVVDGVSQSVPPQKGTGYKLKDFSCTNAQGEWDKNKWGLMVYNMSGKAKCNLEFETVTEITATLYGGVNEVVTIDNEIEYTMDSTGKKENVTILTGEHELKGSISNQTFIVDLNSKDTTFAAMPNNGDGVIYWYGYKSVNWSYPVSYNDKTVRNPSINQNNISIGSGKGEVVGLRTVEKFSNDKYSLLNFKYNFNSTIYNESVSLLENPYYIGARTVCSTSSSGTCDVSIGLVDRDNSAYWNVSTKQYSKSYPPVSSYVYEIYLSN